ncbi:outer membrane lipoprotein carrier protein LolA [Bacteroides sp. 519]|uniref:LolA family protein n=1 Tax=Bacteroides sp. 519 TaxID=2302937 RepID=UPI0013D14D2C|nr:outer membrane lipoprotein carrier protein LolA [Bacteroides sp. 519]NDV60700.1 outer membrane lipoprotein carrier protein LolA [Bacteroides sp. 519]
MKQLIVTLFLSTFILMPVTAQLRPLANQDEFNKRLAQEAQELKSIESDFTQYKYLDVFDETITSKGQFFYKKENKICMSYSKPLDYLIVINNTQLKIVSDGKKSIMNLNTNKMMNQMQDMLTACMVGDLSRLSSDYQLSYFEDNNTFTVKIKPVNKNIQAYIVGIEIQLNKKDMSVNKLRLSETETNYTEYVFQNKKFNTLTDDKIFEIR